MAHDDATALLAPLTATGVVATVAALAGAAAVHWLLLRAARRLAAALARRGGAAAPEAIYAWRRSLDRVLLVPVVALWGATAYVVTEQFPALVAWRLLLVCLLQDSFTAPLFKMGEMTYSALDLLLLPACVVGLWVAMGLSTRLARLVLFRSTALQSGAQETVGVLTRVLLTFIGAVMIFQYWGIDLSSLAVLGGALGVGIGFGLQTIANNAVSGVVIGLERPIKAGDYVQVGDLVGTVARIGARSTEIRTADRVTILVPNSRLLEHEVVNWSHDDPTSRVHLPIAVAYGSDLARVRAVLLAAAHAHPEVLADPRPEVQVRGFGDSAIDLELLVWTRHPQTQVKLRSDLYYRIEPLVRREEIVVPYPRHDVRLHAPEIEQAVAAWRRATFPDDTAASADDAIGVASGNGSPIAASIAGKRAGTAADRGGIDGCGAPTPARPSPAIDAATPAAWDDDALRELVARMHGPDGVAVRDRRHLLRTYRRCFVGRDAVDWLVAREGLTRDEAVELGRKLMERRLLRHVLDEHDFKDAALFYRFVADDGPSPRLAAGI